MQRDHRKLEAFQLADQFVLAVYEASRTFPREELFGLTSQLRRASISVPANIVEGCGREGDREFVQFLQVAMGSLREAGYHLSLAHRLGMLDKAGYELLNEKYDHTARVLANLIAARRASL